MTKEFVLSISVQNIVAVIHVVQRTSLIGNAPAVWAIRAITVVIKIFISSTRKTASVTTRRATAINLRRMVSFTTLKQAVVMTQAVFRVMRKVYGFLTCRRCRMKIPVQASPIRSIKRSLRQVISQFIQRIRTAVQFLVQKRVIFLLARRRIFLFLVFRNVRGERIRTNQIETVLGFHFQSVHWHNKKKKPGPSIPTKRHHRRLPFLRKRDR